jgi:hypothetical protein
MNIKLIQHVQKKLDQYDLIDQTLKPLPEESNPWALWCGWMIEWIVAVMLVKMSVSSWWGFIDHFGFSALPFAMRELMSVYSARLEIILVPIYFFTMTYVGLCFHNKTLGQKIFKHKVMTKNNQSIWLYSFASTVSIALAGIPIFTNWIDSLSNSNTYSQQFWYFQFSFKPEAKEESLNLVDIAESNASEEIDWKKAA